MKIFTLLLLFSFFVGNNSFAQDLAIQGIVIPPQNGIIGQAISPVVRIANIGTKVANGNDVGFYLSKDSTLTYSDTFLGSIPSTSLLSITSQNVTAVLNLPSSLNEGVYFLFAYADYAGRVFETNEKNNSNYIQVQLAKPTKDLGIKSITPNSATFSSGGIFSASVIEYNDGNTAVDSNTIGYFISADSILNSEDVLLGIGKIGVVLSNGKATNLPSYQLPNNLKIGNYYIIAFADYQNANIELNEYNNALSTKISIVPSIVDLSILAFGCETPNSICGAAFYPTSAIANNGNTFLKNITIGYYLSSDTVLNIGDTFLASTKTDYLYSGSYSESNPSLIIPSELLSGNYYILAVADYGNTIEEDFESNNVKSLEIVVTSPSIDLSIYTLSVSPSQTAADSYLAVNLYAFNSGNSQASSHIISYFVSKDSVYDQEDTYLSSNQIHGINANSDIYLNPLLYIPNTLTVGSYYVIAIIDYDKEVAEVDEENNWLAVPITIFPPAFDLCISSFSAEQIKVSAGSYVYPQLVVDNFGIGYASSHHVGYFLSADSIYDRNDIYLACDTLSGIYGGNAEGLSPSLFIPANVAVGTYHILAVADYLFSASETNEENNTFCIKTFVMPPSVDLSPMFQSSTIPMVITGIAFQPTIIEHNYGSTLAPIHSVGYYLSTDSSFDISDKFLSSEYVYEISDSSSIILNPSIVIPTKQSPGDYYLLVVSDYLPSIAEANENNNSHALKIKVSIGGADLMIGSFSTSKSNVLAGSFMYVKYTETNVGNLNVQSHSIGYFLSKDSTYDTGDTYLTTDYLALLNAGANRVMNPVLYIPSTVAYGSYYIILVADYGNHIIELDEHNNTKALSVTIGIPTPNVDLSLSYFYTNTDNVARGSAFTVYFNEYNIGTSNSDSHNVSYYLSLDTLFGSDDDYLGYEYVHGVVAESNYYHSTSLNMPYLTDSGQYYLIAVADYGNQILETNENNNLSFIKLRVTEQVITGEANISLVTKSTISLFPNPSNGIVNFSTLENADEIEVSDLNNHLLLNQVVAMMSGNSLNLSSLSEGVYLVKIKKQGNTISVNRIIISNAN